nr:division/cell wall cluster transcriptional repressor MraZ [Bacteroidota bacterium]
MVGLTSTYECKVDAKGRVLLPTKLKNLLLAEIAKGFTLKRGLFSKCLELWPKSEWDKQLEEIDKLNRFSRENVEFIRKFMAGSKPLELDGAGRLLIPKDLIAYAGITKQIVMGSLIDRIEIWDKDMWEHELTKGADPGDLAEKVMGNIHKPQTEL